MAVRTLVAGAVTAPLVTGLVLAFTAVPAAADSNDIVSPSEGEVIGAGPVVDIKADLGTAESGELRLRGPRDDAFHTVDKDWGDLRYRLDVSCFDYDSSCEGEHPAPNGIYTVRVAAQGPLGLLEGKGKQRFTLRVPPEQPEEVAADAKSARTVRIEWANGEEPDLAAYDVLNSSGARVARVPAEQACDGETCSALVDVPASKAGEQAVFAVQARRYTSTAKDETIPSEASQQVAVNLPAPSSFSSNISSHEGAPDVLGGQTGGRDGGHSRSPLPDFPGEPAGAASALPDLQPLASSSQLTLPDIARRSDETFRRRLDYQQPVLPTPTPAPQTPGSADAQAFDSSPGTTTARTMTAAMGPSQWWKTVALGLVLLLVAAHLGAWTWRTRPEPPRARPQKGGGRASQAAPASALAAEAAASAAEQRGMSTEPPSAAADVEPGARAASYRGRRRAL